ncbi:MAG: hypothetical protein KF820_04840 [Candidatus Paracaedibacteraceae bacterium]|nr:hypothetical protein [Candidatus Paracaedibacteraceae bacterium]
MGRVFGSTCLIAGTAIGAGVLALPMVLIHLSLVQSIILMAVVWLIAYYSALLGSELVLRAKAPLSLGSLSEKYSGHGAHVFGQICFLGLCYALLSAYLSGTSSLVLVAKPDWDTSLVLGLSSISYLFVLVLSLGIIDKINRVLFLIMLMILIGFTGILGQFIDWKIPVLEGLQTGSISSMLAAVPVVFTSFGFQIIFHTIGQYLNLCPTKMRRSFFWGSFIPACAYVVWTCVSLLAISSKNPDLIGAIQQKPLDVGQFMTVLGSITQSLVFTKLSWVLSILAIVTSGIGVGLGLVHTLETYLKNRFMSALVTIIPAYLVVSFIPGAFIKALGFAGMILVVIALLLPIYLLYRSDDRDTFYSILKNKLLRWIMVLLSFGIMAIEIAHLLNWL